METDFLISAGINLGINVLYTIVALIIGIGALRFIDKRLMKNISFEEELKKGNLAVSIFASSILLFVALLVVFGFKG